MLNIWRAMLPFHIGWYQFLCAWNPIQDFLWFTMLKSYLSLFTLALSFYNNLLFSFKKLFFKFCVQLCFCLLDLRNTLQMSPLIMNCDSGKFILMGVFCKNELNFYTEIQRRNEATWSSLERRPFCWTHSAKRKVTPRLCSICCQCLWFCLCC